MFELKKTEGKARRGEFTCAHGTVQTPVFMNVGTQGAIKGALSAEDLKNIFKRFYRGDTARAINGSYGLGLSIAESIVEAHKGKIWAESANGYNTFFVQLPSN